MMERRYDFGALKLAASGRWSDIIRALSSVDLSEALARTGRHVRCHNNHGKTRSQFRLFKDFEQTGGGVCNTCGRFPSGFALLSWLNGWEYKRSVKEVANHLGLGAARHEPERRAPATPPALTPAAPLWEVSEANLKRLKEVWNASTPLPSTAGEVYLRSRGITCDLPSSSEVRFHTGLPYWDDEAERHAGVYPALVSLLRAPESGAPLTLHRTYVTQEGQKAPVARPKKLMSAAVDGAITQLGAAVQLFPVRGKVVAVTEGIETALAVRSGYPTLPVWACYSSSVLTNFRPPPGVTSVMIWGDLDESGAGQLAAARLALRLKARGIEPFLFLPGRGRVYLNPTALLGWLTKDEPYADIVAILGRFGYEVVDTRPDESQDWLDVWNLSKRIVSDAAFRIASHLL
jgi:hypothetical protein